MGVTFFILEYTRKTKAYFHISVAGFPIMKLPRRRLQEGRNSIFLHSVYKIIGGIIK